MPSSAIRRAVVIADGRVLDPVGFTARGVRAADRMDQVAQVGQLVICDDELSRTRPIRCERQNVLIDRQRRRVGVRTGVGDMRDALPGQLGRDRCQLGLLPQIEHGAKALATAQN